MANGIQLIAESLAGAKELMDQLSSRCEVEKPEIVGGGDFMGDLLWGGPSRSEQEMSTG